MKIIAFGHKKRVGKDTCTKFLLEHLRTKIAGKNIQRGAFADIIKDIAYLLYGWANLKTRIYYDNHPEEINTPLEQLKCSNGFPLSPRDIWIRLGTNAIRNNVCDETWLYYLINTSKLNNIDILVISDLRFPNEANYIKKNNGLIVKVNNNNTPKTDDVADCALDNYNAWDHVIENHTTLHDLYRSVIEFANKFELTGL